jgi:hypothetical protein
MNVVTRTALIVDDDPQVRLVTGAILDDLGCRVMEANEPIEAVMAAEAGAAFVVLVTDNRHASHGRMDASRVGPRETAGDPGPLHLGVFDRKHPTHRNSQIIWKPFIEAKMARALSDLLNV